MRGTEVACASQPEAADPAGHYPSSCEGYRKHHGTQSCKGLVGTQSLAVRHVCESRRDGGRGVYALPGTHTLGQTPPLPRAHHEGGSDTFFWQMPIKVYCHDMAGDPKEYLTLPRPEKNFASWGTAQSRIYRHHWFKVRIKLFDGKVFANQRDYTFTNSKPGLVITGDRDVLEPRWGTAMSCDGRLRASLLDVRGLPVTVDFQPHDRSNPTFPPGKFFPFEAQGWCAGWVYEGCYVSSDGETFCLELTYVRNDLSDGCDDGNAVSGDGCSAGCTIEDGYVCEHSTEQEQQPDVCTCACGTCDAGAYLPTLHNQTQATTCSGQLVPGMRQRAFTLEVCHAVSETDAAHECSADLHLWPLLRPHPHLYPAAPGCAQHHCARRPHPLNRRYLPSPCPDTWRVVR
eukprot:810942-Rhodomonas_salina.2